MVCMRATWMALASSSTGNCRYLVALVEVALALCAGTLALSGFVVEVAVAMMLECGRAAGLTVDLEVLAKWD